MSIKRQPTPGNGFIYILSNPSMPNVYKVGLTKSSVKQRIQELSTTGVPRPFHAEKVFEIPESKLRSVEQLAHRKLKHKDLHHGKEFFEGSLDDCVTAVQDAIYEITRSDSIDLIGQAKQRAADIQRKREDEQRQKELERKRLADLEEAVRQTNRTIDRQREQFVSQLIEEEKINESALDRFFWQPLAFIIFGGIAIGIMSLGGPLAWIGVPLVAWLLFNKDKNDTRERHLKSAIAKYPYVTKETIKSVNPQPSQPQASQKTESSYKSSPSASDYTDTTPKEWVILKNKIYNKRTNQLFKFGKPEPNSEWIYVFPNSDWSKPFKLRLKHIDKAEFLDTKAIVKCPKCNQRCSIPLKNTVVVECPTCKHNWTQKLIED